MAAGESLVGGLPPDGEAGREIWELAAQLYPVCRSITGDGVRQTLDLLGSYVPLTRHEVPSGTEVLDWVVPPEWNIRSAHITDANGRRVVDLADHSLHVMSYSTPVDARMSLEELRPHLFTLPEQPELIPYRTSYYKPGWGFCLSHRVLETMAAGTYHVVIDATLAAGHLTYAEALIPGESEAEVLLSAHVCHPSLANDNCSGLALLSWLGRHIASRKRRLSYRILFAPGTIGAITWLDRNRDNLYRIKHGLVVSNVGDGGAPTYKRSRQLTAEIDRASALVLGAASPDARLMDFSPYGYDERQYCSPGFDLPVGAFQRSLWGTFPEYHTSADNLDLIRPGHLEVSARLLAGILDAVDGNWVPRSTVPFGEPQLGRRGLYDDAHGRPLPQEVRLALLWVLNLADGQHSLLDMAERANMPVPAIQAAADRLLEAGLLVPEATGATPGRA